MVAALLSTAYSSNPSPAGLVSTICFCGSWETSSVLQVAWLFVCGYEVAIVIGASVATGPTLFIALFLVKTWSCPPPLPRRRRTYGLRLVREGNAPQYLGRTTGSGDFLGAARTGSDRQLFPHAGWLSGSGTEHYNETHPGKHSENQRIWVCGMAARGATRKGAAARFLLRVPPTGCWKSILTLLIGGFPVPP